LKQSAFVVSLLAAAAVVATAPANAQDPKPFQGLYFGLHGGYAWQDVGGAFDNLGSKTNLSAIDLDSGVLGAQLGYNMRVGQFMWGIEADASTDVGSSGSVTNPDPPVYQLLNAETAYLASVRGRLGYVMNDVLAYATLGIGAAEFKFTENAPATPFMGSMRLQETGVVYGGGVEWQIAYGVSVRAEYLHYDVGGIAYIPASFPASDNGDYVKFNDIDVVRAAVNVRLGHY
jgi:outer membrane immunogenic protein